MKNWFLKLSFALFICVSGTVRAQNVPPNTPPIVDFVTRTILFYPNELTDAGHLALLNDFVASVQAGEPDAAKAQAFVQAMIDEISDDLIFDSPLTGELLLDRLDRYFGDAFFALVDPTVAFPQAMADVIQSANPDQVSAALLAYATTMQQTAPETLASWLAAAPAYLDDLKKFFEEQVIAGNLDFLAPQQAPEAPRIEGLTKNIDGSVQLQFSTQPGGTYQVVYKDDLNVSSWSTFPDGTIQASSPTSSYTDHQAVTAAIRFYGVIETAPPSESIIPDPSAVSKPVYETIYPSDTVDYFNQRMNELIAAAAGIPASDDPPSALLEVAQKLADFANDTVFSAPATEPFWVLTDPGEPAFYSLFDPTADLIAGGKLLDAIQNDPAGAATLLTDYLTYMQAAGPAALQSFADAAPAFIQSLQTFITSKVPEVTAPQVPSDIPPGGVPQVPPDGVPQVPPDGVPPGGVPQIPPDGVPPGGAPGPVVIPDIPQIPPEGVPPGLPDGIPPAGVPQIPPDGVIPNGLPQVPPAGVPPGDLPQVPPDGVPPGDLPAPPDVGPIPNPEVPKVPPDLPARRSSSGQGNALRTHTSK